MRHFLVVDIGGTKIATALAHVDHVGVVTLSQTRTRATNAAEGGRAVLGRVCAAASELIEVAHTAGVHLERIGVATAGVVAPVTGVISYASDLMPGWTGIELGAELSSHTGLPVSVLNDVHAHALGESRLGAGRGRTLLLAIGTGLGGALVDENGVDVGARGVAGSIAHLPHPLAAGMCCACGSTTGHLECVVSGTGLASLYNRSLPPGAAPAQDGAEVYQRFQEGDDHARETLTASARALGESLASVASLLDPATIVLTGSATRCGASWWSELRAAYRRDCLPVLETVPIKEGELGGDAALVGAALAAQAASVRSGDEI